MGKTNTAKTAATAFVFAGKTAKELDAALTAGECEKGALVSFLKGREAAGKLRSPSAALLKRLTGEAAPKPAKTEQPKADKATETTKRTTLREALNLEERVAVLEAMVAKLTQGAAPAAPQPVKPAKPKAEAPKAEQAKPAPVKAEQAKPKPAKAKTPAPTVKQAVAVAIDKAIGF